MLEASGRPASRRYASYQLPVPREVDYLTPAVSQPSTSSPLSLNVVKDDFGGFRTRNPFRLGVAGSSGSGKVGPWGAVVVNPSGAAAGDYFMFRGEWEVAGVPKYGLSFIKAGNAASTGAFAKDGTSSTDWQFPLGTGIGAFEVKGDLYSYVFSDIFTAPPGGGVAYSPKRVRYASDAWRVYPMGAGTLPTMTIDVVAGGNLDSQCAYAVELAVLEGTATTVSSSPQRVRNVTTGVVQLVWPRAAVGQTVKITFASDPSVFSTAWDVIRFYRCVNILGTSPGSVDEMYLVQEYTRAQWQARTGGDLTSWSDAGSVTDAVLLGGGNLVSFPDLDLSPIGASTAAVWLGGRFFFASWSGTRVGVWRGGAGKYCEVYDQAEIIDCGPDSGAITALAVMGDDLLVCRKGRTGVIYNAASDEFPQYTEIDSGNGVASPLSLLPIKRRAVLGSTMEGMRACALYEWNKRLSDSVEVGGLLPSSAFGASLRGCASGDVAYAASIKVGEPVLSFSVDDDDKVSSELDFAGEPVVPLFSYGGKPYFWLSANGAVAVLEPGDPSVDEMDLDGTDDEEPIGWAVQMAALTVEEGSGMLEHAVLDLMVQDCEAELEVSVEGTYGSSRSGEPTTPTVALLGTNEGHLFHYPSKLPGRSRIFGERLYYTLSGEGRVVVTGVRWNGYLLTGSAVPGFWPAQDTFATALLRSFTTGVSARLSRPDHAREAFTGEPLEEVP